MMTSPSARRFAESLLEDDRDLSGALAAIQKEMEWPKLPRVIQDFGDLILIGDHPPMESTWTAEIDPRGRYRPKSIRRDDVGA